MLNSTLVADVGGTNVRFGIVSQDANGTYTVEHCEQVLCARFANFSAALADYLRERTDMSFRSLAISVAGPVCGDQAVMTNLSWSFDANSLRDEFGLGSVYLVHDLAAQALAIPRLAAGDFEQVRQGRDDRQGARAVIGLGTGLGIARLDFVAGGWHAFSGEGGHASFAPRTAVENAIFDQLSRECAYVSLESVLSGPGLLNIYRALAAVNKADCLAQGPKDVLHGARDGSDPLCTQAVKAFVGLLGNVVGNTALTLGARGGVYLAGGLTKHLLPFLRHEVFRQEFAASGFRKQYLEDIPVYAVVHPFAGLVGASTLLKSRGAISHFC